MTELSKKKLIIGFIFIVVGSLMLSLGMVFVFRIGIFGILGFIFGTLIMITGFVLIRQYTADYYAQGKYTNKGYATII